MTFHQHDAAPDIEKVIEDSASHEGTATPPSPTSNEEQQQDERWLVNDLPRQPETAKTKDSPSTLEAQRPHTPPESNVEPVVKIPRSQRRGILGRFTLVAEVDRPRDLPRSKKWFITWIVAMAALVAPMGSAILFPSLVDITTSLDSTPTITNLSVAFYMLSLAFFPLFWSSFSESSGRRSIYVISFTLSVVFNVLSAVSTNIAMFIVMRILSGGASASVQVVGAGTIADVWPIKERGKAINTFYLGPLMGPMLAPTIGGALQLRWGWRSTMWFLAIYSFVVWSLLLWCLPETLASTKPIVPVVEESEKTGTPMARVSTMQSVHKHTKRVGWVLHRTCIEPFKVLGLLRFPPVALAVFYVCIIFGSLYVLNISIQATYEAPPYSFTALQIGLSYLANSSGYGIAAIFGGRWVDYLMKRTAQRAGRRDEDGNLILRTEDRVQENVWLGALLCPVAMIWYGWTAEFHVHWAIPLVANFFFGLAAMLLFGAVMTMLTEYVPRRSSSGMAVNNFMRNTVACIMCIVAQPLLDAISNGWLFTMLGLIAFVGCIMIWALSHYGAKWATEMEQKLSEQEQNAQG